MLGISVPGVKSRVQRGRAKLRRMFGECCQLELDVRRRVVSYHCRAGGDPADVSRFACATGANAWREKGRP